MRNQLTLEYFQDLTVLAVNCDRSIEVDADVKMVESLREDLTDIERYTHNIIAKARELDGYWESEEEKGEYISQIQKHRDILLEESQAIDPQQGISEERGDKIRNSVNVLDDCAIGIYEDL